MVLDLFVCKQGNTGVVFEVDVTALKIITTVGYFFLKLLYNK
jgi:hypothetical protein